MMNCAIIDDEPLAREGLSTYVREIDFLHLTGTCENPIELTMMLDKYPVDLIFLDIQMPKMSGLDFLKSITKPPIVIITTAFPSYALEGFQLDVLDYLVKPITLDRFFKSVNKAKDYYNLINKSTVSSVEKVADYCFIKCGSKFEKIHFADILFAEGMQNYVTIYTRKGKYTTLLNLKSLEEHLSDRSFMRIHKSYIVSVEKIEGMEGSEIFIQSHRIPIGRNYRDEVLQQVIKNKLWIR